MNEVQGMSLLQARANGENECEAMTRTRIERGVRRKLDIF